MEAERTNGLLLQLRVVLVSFHSSVPLQMLPVSGCRSDTRPALVMSTPGQLVHTSKGRAPLMYYTSRTPRCFTVPPPLPEADHHLRDYHQAHPTIQGHRPSLQASRSDCSQPTGGARVPSHVPTTKPYLRPSPMPLVSF